MPRRAILVVTLVALAVALWPGAGAAAPRLVEIGRFDQPVHIASPPDDLRLFVVEQPGRIRVLDASGTLVSTPFLDVSGEVVTSYEQGLLSLAFAPDYATSGLAYVFLTARQPSGQLQVREYRRSAADPNRLDPSSMRLVVAQDHAENDNHNGGGMLFGPDGRLWISMGDGGAGNDPPNNAQTRTTLLGKLLRIDPRGPIPEGNPYGPADPHRDEIWAYGLRNPWRFSFDRQTGDLVIADVGQGEREEIDFAPAAQGRLPGADYGWRCREGTLATPGVVPCDPGSDYVPPVFELDHQDDGVVSITGGYVVRDPGLPTLAGRYLYGDIGLSKLRSVVLSASGASGDREEDLAVETVSTFGEDACGRLLVASLTGPVYRIVDGEPSACPPPPPSGGGGGGAGGGGGGTPPTAAPASCGAAVGRAYARSRRTAIRRGLAVGIRVRSRCRVSLAATVGSATTPRSRERTLVAGQRVTLRVRLSPRAARALRRALARRRSVLARLTATATPEGGAATTFTRRVRIRR